MMDKYELINSIILQLDALADARGVERCAALVEIVQKLTALKNGLKSDDEAHKNTVAVYEQQIKNLTTPHPEEGEEVLGGETYTIGGGDPCIE